MLKLLMQVISKFKAINIVQPERVLQELLEWHSHHCLPL